MDRSLEALLDESIDPLFWPADRLGAASAWWQHVPFAHWLMSEAKPRIFVELGTHTGVSYSAFCSAILRRGLATRAYAVDTWTGDKHTESYGEEVFNDFRAFHETHYSDFSCLLRATFDEAWHKFDDSSIDLLHIDGLHTYEAVKHDFENWFVKLSPEAIVLFHDTNARYRDFGVWRLWAELSQRFPAFEFLHGWGLGVLAVGEKAAASVKALCELRDGQQIARVRERFAVAGERWTSEMESRARIEAQERSVMERFTADLDAARKNTGDLQESLEAVNRALTQRSDELQALRAHHENACRELDVERERAERLREEVLISINDLALQRQRSAQLEQKLAEAAKDLLQEEERNARMVEEVRAAAKDLTREKERAAELNERVCMLAENLSSEKTQSAQLNAELERLRKTVAEQQAILEHVNNSRAWRWIVRYRTWIEQRKANA